MNKMSIPELISLFISVSVFISGIVAWWSARVQKSYAAQRDFAHLKNNYEQLARNQSVILDEIKEASYTITSAMERQMTMLNILIAKSSGEDSFGSVLQQLKAMNERRDRE